MYKWNFKADLMHPRKGHSSTDKLYIWTKIVFYISEPKKACWRKRLRIRPAFVPLQRGGVDRGFIIWPPPL